MKIRYSKVGGLLAGIYQAVMLALYLIAENSQENEVDGTCLYIAVLLTFPWSFMAVPFAWFLAHNDFSVMPLFAVFTAVNAFGLYKIGNSVTLGVDE